MPRSRSNIAGKASLSATRLGYGDGLLDGNGHAEAAPGFYHRPTQVSELVDFIVQRILDQLELDIEIASTDQFIPELPGWQERSPFISQVGRPPVNSSSCWRRRTSPSLMPRTIRRMT